MIIQKVILGAMLLLAGGLRVLSAQQQGPTIGPCPVFPADNVWNTRVDHLPRDPNADKLITTIGANLPLHMDFASGMWEGAPVGIPFMVIPGNQKRVPVKFEYANDSDLSNYPIPPNAPIERNGDPKSDRHILLIDRDNCVLWELYGVTKQGGASWTAGSGAIFDLKCNCMRPDGWTSADAAGLSVFAGLARYDEVAAGEIRHALRFTAPKTRKAWIWPARHAASSLTDGQYPPMGQRFRLKAAVDISGYSREAQVFLRALKKYGMILADNGSPWFVSGAPDERWNNSVMAELKKIKGSDFEGVNWVDSFVSHHSARAQQPK